MRIVLPFCICIGPFCIPTVCRSVLRSVSPFARQVGSWPAHWLAGLRPATYLCQAATVKNVSLTDVGDDFFSIAFVPQEDVMHRELTVLDNITFSANMRLPANWTEEQKREKEIGRAHV